MRDCHLSLLWSKADRDEAYAINDTLDLCFPDTKTKQRKTTTKMTTDNVDCDHDTVREGVKSYMESVRSTAASASSSLASQHFLIKISGHASVLRRLLSSSRNSKKNHHSGVDSDIFPPTRISIPPVLSKTMPIQARFYQTKIEE